MLHGAGRDESTTEGREQKPPELLITRMRCPERFMPESLGGGCGRRGVPGLCFAPFHQHDGQIGSITKFATRITPVPWIQPCSML